MIHEWVKVDDPDSFGMARELIKKEGLLVGGSAGSCLSGALKYLKDKQLADKENLRCVIFIPDSIRNYMTKFLDENWLRANNLQN